MQTNALLHTVLPPIHLFTYSTLLGMELYQTFAITKITYQTLSRTAFTTLQKRLFPIYFQGQSLLLVILAATYPPYGLISVIEKKKDWVSFAIAAMTVGLNLTIYGPRTKNLMIERIHQATRDAKVQQDEREPTEGMIALNRSFSRAHAMSIHLNLITICVTFWHGWRLASRLRFEVD